MLLVKSFVFIVSIKFWDQSGLAIINYVNVSTLAFYIGKQRDIAQGLRIVVTCDDKGFRL